MTGESEYMRLIARAQDLKLVAEVARARLDGAKAAVKLADAEWLHAVQNYQRATNALMRSVTGESAFSDWILGVDEDASPKTDTEAVGADRSGQ